METARVCIGCGNEYQASRERKFCTKPCGLRYRNHQNYIHELENNPNYWKICEHCNSVFARKPHRSCASMFEKRRFCSDSCRSKGSRKSRNAKFCEQCGGQLFTEKPSELLTRRFCSKNCSNAFQSVSQNHPVYKARRRTTSGYIVSSLGAGRLKFEHRTVAETMLGRSIEKHECVHHIDLDKLNNEPKNLLVLSKRNHAVLHHELGRRYMEEHQGILPSDLLALGVWVGGVSPRQDSGMGTTRGIDNNGRASLDNESPESLSVSDGHDLLNGNFDAGNAVH